MTKENLLKYLKEPTYLQQISYQELKTLVAEHPNSLSLRYLLAVKSKQENNSDFERQLSYLATYGYDRAHFYDVFNKKDLPNEMVDVIPQEDFLELKELSALERELQAKPISRTSDFLFEMEPPTPILPTYDVPKMVPQKELATLEDEDYYVLNFEEELDTSSEQVGQQVMESRVKGNLAEIEDLFKDLEEEELPTQMPTELLINGASKDLTLQETVKGGDFPDIPLEVLDTNMDLISKGASIAPIAIEQAGQGRESANQSKPAVEKVEQQGDSKTSEELNQLGPEIVPEITEETLVVNPIPKSSFSTWYDHGGEIPTFSGYDLVGFNSRGIVKELSASEKEIQIAERIREEKLRIAKLQAAKRTISNKETGPVDTKSTHSVTQGIPPQGAIKKKQKQILREIKNEAESSFVFEEDIASETLAQLLVLQGHYSKARAMYEHLSLIFPEKSGLFAYEIQKIENLEDEVA